jgi:hypothetical protein
MPKHRCRARCGLAPGRIMGNPFGGNIGAQPLNRTGLGMTYFNHMIIVAPQA